MAEQENPLMPPVDKGDPDMEADLPADLDKEADEEPSESLLDDLGVDKE